MGFEPFAARVRHQTPFPRVIVAAEGFEGFMVVYERPAMPELMELGLGVTVLWWHKDRINTPLGYASRDENTTLQDALVRIKKSMLSYGATAEAVMLIGAISPFTTEELNIMAEKLARKTLPADPKVKPVGGGGAVVAKASRAAAAKEGLEPKPKEAGENKRAAARLVKIKALKKIKEIVAREGTFRLEMLTAVLTAKTVGEFYEMSPMEGKSKFDASCLRFAEEHGYVSLG